MAQQVKQTHTTTRAHEYDGRNDRHTAAAGLGFPDASTSTAVAPADDAHSAAAAIVRLYTFSCSKNVKLRQSEHAKRCACSAVMS